MITPFIDAIEKFDLIPQRKQPNMRLCARFSEQRTSSRSPPLISEVQT